VAQKKNSALLAMSSQIACFSSCIVCGQFLYTNYFKTPHRKKSGTVRSGNLTSLHMKMDFVTHYHITYSTKPLLLNRFWNSISCLSYHADSAPLHRAKVHSEMCLLALHNLYNNIFHSSTHHIYYYYGHRRPGKDMEVPIAYFKVWFQHISGAREYRRKTSE